MRELIEFIGAWAIALLIVLCAGVLTLPLLRPSSGRAQDAMTRHLIQTGVRPGDIDCTGDDPDDDGYCTCHATAEVPRGTDLVALATRLAVPVRWEGSRIAIVLDCSCDGFGPRGVCLTALR